MSNSVFVRKNYLWIPVCLYQEKADVELFCEGKKLYEFKIPMSMEKKEPYGFHYYAPLKVSEYIGKEIIFKGASDAFIKSILQEDHRPASGDGRPLIHLTAEEGWINDPNGLYRKNGIYHACYQYNPFDIEWENMSWGSAVSKDLLHWEMKDVVMYPDEEGTMFSGSAVIGEGKVLGLPENTPIYFYTCAGGSSRWSRKCEFTQKMAVSLDDGETLQKKDIVVEHIVGDNRDPKVYRYENTDDFYMILYLDKNDFGIFTSKDLVNWSQTQIITLPGTSECPDLRAIPVEGGGGKWVLWTANGYYYIGDFDGKIFTTDYKRHEAYRNTVPYAAQTCHGTGDVITIPWLRLKNSGNTYTGAFGLPRKMSLAKTSRGLRLRMSPVDSFLEQRELVCSFEKENNIHCRLEDNCAVNVEMEFENTGDFELDVFENKVIYSSASGKLYSGDEEMLIGKNLNHFSILIDGEIMEVWAENGLIYGVIQLKNNLYSGTVRGETSESCKVNIFRIR